ncbi:MAG: hypothetical protein BroJett003_07770 [Planctomycetota bacterium]|nr:MAG: hypothetical protein BroJett003_07770 [Planctomycetota bacterium]
MSQSPKIPAARWFGQGFTTFLRAFTDLLRLPIAFWIVIAVFVVETMAYFAALTLMNSFLTRDLGIPATWAGWIVSFFTMFVTLFMLGAGSYAESFGLRKALVAAMLLCVAGRVAYALIPALMSADPDTQTLRLGGLALTALLACLVVIALGEAILQPVCYSGVKQYTDEKTSAMGYGLIYALMNAGIVVGAALSSYVRPGVQVVIEARTTGTDVASSGSAPDAVHRWFADRCGSGFQAVNWICVALAAIALVMCFLMTRRVEARKLRPDNIERRRRRDTRPIRERLREYFLEGPFRNGRFIFFIFMLLPVRTLFAHQWLTMPEYILRVFSRDVSDRMEWLVNWINPGIIFFGVPIATALTRRVNVYTMMIIGSLVSALPTFLLCASPNVTLLITYFVVFSIGEALWSARFLEYASELAPEGRIAQYMGLANVPWLLAKGTTGLYSGYVLDAFCPPKADPTTFNTSAMWLLYGMIAMASPVGLMLARRWAMTGMKPARRDVAER